MDNSEARVGFVALSDALRAHGLGWIADQVDQSTARGITEPVPPEELADAIKTLGRSEFPEVLEDGRVGWSRRKEISLRTRPYSDRERLAALLDAVERTAQDGAALTSAVTAFLTAPSSDLPHVRAVRFVSDEDGAMTVELEATSKAPDVSSLRDAIASLRRAL